jgi:hypothetical protein
MSVTSQLLGLYPLGTGPYFPSDYPLEVAVPPYEKISYPIEKLKYDALPGRF